MARALLLMRRVNTLSRVIVSNCSCNLTLHHRGLSRLLPHINTPFNFRINMPLLLRERVLLHKKSGLTIATQSRTKVNHLMTGFLGSNIPYRRYILIIDLNCWEITR